MCTRRRSSGFQRIPLLLSLALGLAFPLSALAKDVANGNGNNAQRGGFANGVNAGGNNINQGIGQQVAPWAQQGIQGQQLAALIAQLLDDRRRGNNAGQGVGRWNAGQSSSGQGFGGREWQW
jgi:hypothetical protein